MTAADAAPTEAAEDFKPDPGALLSALVQHMNLKNDAALSRALGVPAHVVSKVRHARVPVGAVMLIRMHEASGISIRNLRRLMGDRRAKFRPDVKGA